MVLVRRNEEAAGCDPLYTNNEALTNRRAPLGNRAESAFSERPATPWPCSILPSQIFLTTILLLPFQVI
jgi:hypothetical protein